MSQKDSISRRRFLTLAGVAAAVPAAAAVLGPASARLANAATSDSLPTYAPVPPSALGHRLNADGYFVDRIADDLFWVTDSFYQAMFLTTREGVVLVDAPPTIGHNLQRAIDVVTSVNGRPNK